jgi:plasmid stabilization system protein ParE
MRRIIWLDSAKLNLIDIRAYYSEHASTKVTRKLLQRINAPANKLADQPLMGVTTMGDDILEWHIPGLSYTLPYRLDDEDGV